MSALPLGGGGDLFHRGGSAIGDFQYLQKESRSSYNMEAKKKRRAPQPPHAGLQRYKPKILNYVGDANVPVARSQRSPVPPPRPSKARGLSSASGNGDVSVSKPIVMGDKDVPVALLDTQDDPEGVDLNVSSLNLTSHDLLCQGQDGGTDNPLFDMHDESVTVPHSTVNPLFHMQEESSPVPHSTDNLLFNMPDSNTSGPQPSKDSVLNSHGEGLSAQDSGNNPVLSTQEEGYSSPPLQSNSDHDDTAQRKGEEPEGVYIPAPDYEEEEMMMSISEEPEEEHPNSTDRPTRVFKEYAGEDFGQYLSDEENGYEEILRRASRPNLHADHKSKTEPKRPQNKKREPLPLKNKKDKGVNGYSSLRNFSYADSKFGTISRQKNQTPVSRPEGNKEADIFVDTGASYEQFLYSKNGDHPGIEMDPSSKHPASSGQPEQAQHKDSMWKKLTWRVKKQMNSFDLTATS
ncbi:hypothetical protein ACOMHN_034133 [Nucella lapillus]